MIGPQRACQCLSQRPAEWGGQWQHRTLGRTAEAPALLDEVIDQMWAMGYPRHDVFAFRLALEEALLNAILHGHRGDPGKTVVLRFCVDETFLVAQVEDEGPGFDLQAVPDPREAVAPSPNGWGLLLMKHYASSVEYNPAGNCVTLCKHRSRPSGI
jgi:serine/threonine-protein kinase RsbW